MQELKEEPCASGRFEVTSPITSADMESALKFIGKRVRRHRDPVDGLNASLFAVMLVTGRALVDSGLPVSSVASILDQFKEQVCELLRQGGAE